MQQQLPLKESSAPAAALLKPTPVIHLVDDDESFRKAVSRLLQAAGYLVQTYATAGEFLLARFGDAHGCVLLDIRMPGLNGLDLQETLAKHEVQLPVIFLTGHGNIPMSVRAMKAGAVDFLTKPVKRETLLPAIQAALAKDTECRAAREESRKWRTLFEGLTAREREVFERVVTGRLNKQIAAELGTAERTVKAHRAHIMEKMHAQSLAHLVHIAGQLRAKPASPGPRAQV
jgi:FixJ family two-component response regulator